MVCPNLTYQFILLKNQTFTLHMMLFKQHKCAMKGELRIETSRGARFIGEREIVGIILTWQIVSWRNIGRDPDSSKHVSGLDMMSAEKGCRLLSDCGAVSAGLNIDPRLRDLNHD